MREEDLHIASDQEKGRADVLIIRLRPRLEVTLTIE